MVTKYECDITGKQYEDEEMIREIGLFDTHGEYVSFDYGPEATIDDIRAKLSAHVAEMEPFHQDWWDDQTDTYTPPQIVTEVMAIERGKIRVPTIQKKTLDN